MEMLDEIHQSVTLINEEEAEDFFVFAKDRLLDVNKWHELTGEATRYYVTDAEGKELHHHVHADNFIKCVNGENVEWYLADEIAYDDYPDEHIESIVISLVKAMPGQEIVENDDRPVYTVAVARAAAMVAAAAVGLDWGALVSGLVYIEEEE